MEKANDFEHERQRLTQWAWGVTAAYAGVLLILAAFVVYGEGGVDSFREMSPNEVGDLLAGIAGPLAFIWLVYGYFLQGIAIRQQAEELRQNTRALHLQEDALRAQAQEMMNAVAQQRELVEVARRQADMQEESATPIFAIEIKRVLTEYSQIRANLKNIGGAATDIEITSSEEISEFHPKSIASIDKGAETEFRWKQRLFSPTTFPAGGNFWLQISCRDAAGKAHLKSYEFVRSDTTPGGFIIRQKPSN